MINENNVLRILAHHISKLQPSDVPERIKHLTKLRVLDTVAAAVGGVDNKQWNDVIALYRQLSGQSGDSSIWASYNRTSAPTAGFLNAMAAHTLELDDVHTASKTHIGTVVVPAAWALAERQKATGANFLMAVLCGYEVMSRIGIGFGVSSHRNKGWHVTSTAGTFGAAAACSRLLELDGDQSLSALGLAGTQSFGLWAFLEDGASNKVLHPARAASSGMEAALLASIGMSGPGHILDAKDGGLFPATSDEYDYGAVSRDLGTRFEIEYMDNKPYPCCRSTHCVIDAALALRKEHNLAYHEIKSIEVQTYLVGYKQCGVSDGSLFPRLPTEAKFSTPYTAAAALIHGEVSLRHFLPEVIADDQVQTLLRKVKVMPHDKYTNQYPEHWGCVMRITCNKGRILEKEVTDASGSIKNPLTESQIRNKALGLLQSGCPKRAEKIVDEIMSMEQLKHLPAVSDMEVVEPHKNL